MLRMQSLPAPTDRALPRLQHLCRNVRPPLQMVEQLRRIAKLSSLFGHTPPDDAAHARAHSRRGVGAGCIFRVIPCQRGGRYCEDCVAVRVSGFFNRLRSIASAAMVFSYRPHPRRQHNVRNWHGPDTGHEAQRQADRRRLLFFRVSSARY